MNVSDVLQDNVTDKIYASILFNLVNLPYRDNSIDIETILIDGKEFKCYKNHYRFTNGTMVIIKIASIEFVPYGIYARKIINFLIAEFTYKMSMPNIYNKNTQRMIHLGKKPIDFVEKICGKRKSGSSSAKSILKQLQAILNCRMAIATGYKQINPKDDEALAHDRYQFGLIETDGEQLVNHDFNVFESWREEIYVSEDLAKIFSQHILPLDKNVYDKITRPMELDQYQYFIYQGYQIIKKGMESVDYSWDEAFKLFGRGYAKTSRGIANFRSDFRKNLDELQKKINLDISAPIDGKYITFKPQFPSIIAAQPKLNLKAINTDYNDYKPMLEILPKIDNKLQNTTNDNMWHSFIAKYNLKGKFDLSAIKYIKKHFEKDNINTTKTVEYIILQSPPNPSATIIKALRDNWLKKGEIFNAKLSIWQNMCNKLSKAELHKINNLSTKAIDFLSKRYIGEEFNFQTLRLIYAGYLSSTDKSEFISELDGSKFKIYFTRHFELLDC